MTLRRAEFHRVERKAADQFLEAYEHLGDVGLGVWHWGLAIDQQLASVLSFGVPCFDPRRSFLAGAALGWQFKILQLCRGGTAPWAPKNTPSYTIARAIRQIGIAFGPALIVAYADSAFAEVGTIYQAANAIYTGLTDPKGQADYVINGRLLSGWVVRKRFGTRCRKKLREIDPDVKIVPLLPKFRYVLPAGPFRFRRDARAALARFAAPYPRRSDLGISGMNVEALIAKRFDETFRNGVRSATQC